jgi:hypothetical protein
MRAGGVQALIDEKSAGEPMPPVTSPVYGVGRI